MQVFGGKVFCGCNCMSVAVGISVYLRVGVRVCRYNCMSVEVCVGVDVCECVWV